MKVCDRAFASQDLALAAFALLHWRGVVPQMVVQGPLLGRWPDAALQQFGTGAMLKTSAALPVGCFALCLLARRATPCLARLVTAPGRMLGGGGNMQTREKGTGGVGGGGAGGGAASAATASDAE